jgi:hypothetical protein
MQVDGVQVNPVEWWDPHWVKDRVLSKMGADLDAGTAQVDTPSPAPRASHQRAAKKKKKRG